MKKFIETLKNIYNIEELRKRIGYTILLVLVYRLGNSYLKKLMGFSKKPS